MPDPREQVRPLAPLLGERGGLGGQARLFGRAVLALPQHGYSTIAAAAGTASATAMTQDHGVDTQA